MIAKGSHVCTQCGCAMKPKIGFRGSALLEVLLWAVPAMQLFGLIYTVWRCNTKVLRCTNCDSDRVVPIKSDSARPFLIGYDKIIAQPKPDEWFHLTNVAQFMVILVLFVTACFVFYLASSQFVKPVK